MPKKKKKVLLWISVWLSQAKTNGTHKTMH